MSKPKAASVPKARVFVPLTKVDEEQRLVYGRITQEMLDKSKEVMDYTTSKPFFEKWSSDIHANSNGLSKGNVRVMHGLVAAGKLTELDFNDEDQAIDVCAKVVDDAEWNKCLEGVYTGFSVGGNYEKRWTDTVDGEKIKKYTANPNEVSLVDNPCVPSATFTMLKADGAEEQVAFQVENDDNEWPGFAKAEGEVVEEEAKEEVIEKTAPAPVVEPANTDVVAKAEEMAKAAGTGSWMDHVAEAREVLIKEAAAKAKEAPPAKKEGEEEEPEDDKKPKDKKEKAEKVTPPGIRQGWAASDGQFFDKKADAEAHDAALAKNETEVEKLARLLKTVTEGVETVEAARTGEDSIFADYDRLHKAFVELDQPREADGAPKLEKGMYTVSRFARMIGDVADLTTSIKAEGVLEGEDGEDENVSATLKASLSSFGDNFMVYAKQQVAELLKGIDKDCSPRACYDYYYRADGADNDLHKDVASLIEAVKEDVEWEGTPEEQPVEKLSKAAGGEEDDTLQKRFDDLQSGHTDLLKVAKEAIDQLGGLAKRVKELEDTPLPRAPANVIHKDGDQFLGKSVSSDADKVAVVQELLKTHGADGVATMMIKAAQQNGQVLHLKGD